MSLCTYCRNLATTTDHVPPECLFAKPLPNTLITVPSCYLCNHGAHLDDEYFRLMLTANRNIDHPDAIAGRKSSVRSLTRPEAPGLRLMFVGTLRDEDILSPAGLYLGTAPTYGAETGRLCRVIRRVTLGLRYHETAQGFEADEHVVVLIPGAVKSDDTRGKLVQDAKNVRRFGRPGTTARNVLTYWWARVAGHSNASAWLLRFYNREFFMTYIWTRPLVPANAPTPDQVAERLRSQTGTRIGDRGEVEIGERERA